MLVIGGRPNAPTKFTSRLLAFETWGQCGTPKQADHRSLICRSLSNTICSERMEISRNPILENLMSIPLKIYITPFSEKGVLEPGKWSCDAAKRALDVVNTIWSKAKIAFVINDCLIDKPLDMAKSARNDDRRMLGVLSLRHDPDNAVHIYLVNPIQNLPAGGARTFTAIQSRPALSSGMAMTSPMDAPGPMNSVIS